MSRIEGHYFDGRTSRRRPASLVIYRDGGVRLELEGEVRTFAFEEIDFGARLGNTPRGIRLPDGGRFETSENDRVDEVLEQFGRRRGSRWLHRMESRLQMVLLAVVIVAVSVGAFLRYGIPALASAAAFALPAKTSRSIGQGALEILDRSHFGPSEIDERRQRRIRSLFEGVTRDAGDPQGFELVFRKGQALGANALALPSGTVVLTDELIALAENEEEIVAVLAHEVGHVVRRHALRQAIQHSMVALLVILVTGDLSSTSSLVAAVPTLLVEARFSQAFEREADGYALAYLLGHGIDPVHFANLMRRLGGRKAEGSILGYFSSHPSTPERIRRFEDARRRE